MNEPRPMSDMMKEAHQRASRYAPLPEWRPVTGGLAGVAIACVPMIIFGMNVGVSVYALILNAVIGFALPFFWLKSRQNAHDRAWNRELEAIRGREEQRLDESKTEISLKL